MKLSKITAYALVLSFTATLAFADQTAAPAQDGTPPQTPAPQEGNSTIPQAPATPTT